MDINCRTFINDFCCVLMFLSASILIFCFGKYFNMYFAEQKTAKLSDLIRVNMVPAYNPNLEKLYLPQEALKNEVAEAKITPAAVLTAIKPIENLPQEPLKNEVAEAKITPTAITPIENLPIAVTINEVNFIFDETTYVTAAVVTPSVLKKEACLTIPNDAVFTVKNENGQVSFKMMIISDSKSPSFIANHQYQVAPHLEPTKMSDRRSISLVTNTTIKVKLFPGTKYYTIIDGIKLVCNDKAIVNTIADDTTIIAELII